MRKFHQVLSLYQGNGCGKIKCIPRQFLIQSIRRPRVKSQKVLTKENEEDFVCSYLSKRVWSETQPFRGDFINKDVSELLTNVSRYMCTIAKK